jgi:DNA polymerase III subunit gamma/tau
MHTASISKGFRPISWVFSATLILCRIAGCDQLLDLPAEEIAAFKEMARQHSLETLHQKLSLLMAAVEEIRYATQPRLALETAFLKIIEAGNVVAVTTLIGRLEDLLNLEKALPGSSPPQPPPAAAPSVPSAAADPAPAAATAPSRNACGRADSRPAAARTPAPGNNGCQRTNCAGSARTAGNAACRPARAGTAEECRDPAA